MREFRNGVNELARRLVDDIRTYGVPSIEEFYSLISDIECAIDDDLDTFGLEDGMLIAEQHVDCALENDPQ